MESAPPSEGSDDGALKLKSLLAHLRTESSILDRMVYKNKNQHRRCHYFHSVLKVRRDTRLLLSAKLEDILSCAFEVINGRNPSQKLFLLERLKNRTFNGANDFLERLLGIARLLSQMVEPILRAATEISSLLAKSFFMGFSLTVLSLLARLRVLVQQMLVECVSIYNKVTLISRESYSAKLVKNGLEVYREYYPPSVSIITLECAWEGDKFVLAERQDLSKGEEKPLEPNLVEVSSLLYEVVGVGSQGDNASDSREEGNMKVKHQEQSICGDDSQTAGIQDLGELGPKRKVAFVSVTTSSSSSEACKAEMPNLDVSCNPEGNEAQDPFFSLLSAGNLKGSLFGS